MQLHVLHVLVYTAHTLKFDVARFFGLLPNIIPTKISTELKPRAPGLVYPATVTFHYSFKNSLSLSLRLGEVDWLTEGW